ncbi:MAG: phage tail sheath family protein, partial [Allosphingosinicella sp.]
NGGGAAWIVSAGPFGEPAKADFLAGLATLEKEPGPAILAAPGALRLSAEDYHEVARAMIAHCAGLGSRMAILDLHGGNPSEAAASDLAASLGAFRAALAEVPQEHRSFAAAYHPWIVTAAGTVPPSAAMAGIWARTDADAGVWQAPANTPVGGANDVAIGIDDAMQQDMNVPLDGLAVNAIRPFAGRGVLVWGARTLDGNSQDFRYIPVRRTAVMIEQSIRLALEAYAFEPNVAATWATVRSMVAAFLTAVWKEGGLQGSRPDDAFAVQCGLGTTMTAEDIVEGRMLVTVLVAVVRPAEFLALTFAQQMASS